MLHNLWMIDRLGFNVITPSRCPSFAIPHPCRLTTRRWPDGSKCTNIRKLGARMTEADVFSVGSGSIVHVQLSPARAMGRVPSSRAKDLSRSDHPQVTLRCQILATWQQCRDELSDLP
jgi:hypothetical protein